MSYQIGFIGVGNMASAIFESFVEKNILQPKSIYIYDIDLNKTKKLKEQYHVNVSKSITDLGLNSDVIVLGVTPDQLDIVFRELSKVLTNQMIFSIAVGITLDKLGILAKKDLTIVRTMPNIGAKISKSMTSYCVNKKPSAYELDVINTFLNAFGRAIEVREDKFDEFTALCGSSPAFYLEMMHTMIEYGLNNGFRYDDLVEMVSESMIASALLLQSSNLKAKELIDKIATKGGTTEAGLKVLRKHTFDEIIMETLVATSNESKKTK